MKFLVDNQLPAALARWLTAMGAPADHVLDRRLQFAGDSDIWALCVAENRIVFSKDVDFLLLASRPADTGQLLWVRIGNCRKQAILTRFAASWVTIQAAFDVGQRVVELQ
jgi:predicted nuclease of predicted toxin-antitoxin system